MISEPRFLTEYGERQVEAARRVLIDIGQVLGSFVDSMLLVGGWVPELVISAPSERHSGSIDVDFLLDAQKLENGGYAALVQLLLDTRRYKQGSKAFQLVAEVDLADDKQLVLVEVDFLAPRGAKFENHTPTLIPDFRVLEVDVSGQVFDEPTELTLPGKNMSGAENTVRLRVVTGVDFLVMKAYALRNRDKPKDAYDICYYLDHAPDGLDHLAEEWRAHKLGDQLVEAERIFLEKFSSVNAFGPQQVAQFYGEPTEELSAMRARRAYELVAAFLERIRPGWVRARRRPRARGPSGAYSATVTVDASRWPDVAAGDTFAGGSRRTTSGERT